MINLKKLDGPYGIPVYHQRMPEMIKSVSLGWLMMTGAADDPSVGSSGLHHWFEHVPFRGTKKFPRGVTDLEGPFTSLNGYLNAWTNHKATCYYGTVHEKQWREAITAITDMVANPILSTNGVEAERKIIHQEIAGSLGSAGGKASYELPRILYAGHAFGHPVLGSEKTLASMDATVLRRAHNLGYDRSRAVFICVGNMAEEDLLHAVELAATELPDRHLTERRKPAYFGPLPIWQPGTTEIETEFATSVIYMLFPVAKNHGDTATMIETAHSLGLLDSIFEHGGMVSPLMRIVREDRQLVYGCSTTWSSYAGGGFYGFRATAKKDNIWKIIEAFNDVLKDPFLRSPDRLSGIKSCLTAEVEMMPLDPDEFRGKATSQFLNWGGQMQGYKTIIDRLNKVTLDEVDAKLSTLKPDDARMIIFKGMGK